MMIARSGGFQLLRRCAGLPMPSKIRIRRFTSPSATPPSQATAPVHPLANVTTQIDRVSPRFEVDPSAINILNSPAAFYETLKVLQMLYPCKNSSKSVSGQNQKGSQTGILVDTLHWQDRARIDRYSR
jgi:hypothetical protein